jgi:hypothetical protein
MEEMNPVNDFPPPIPETKSEVLSVDSIKIKNELGFEGIVAQIQRFTKNVLAVEDGATLKVYPESGTFTLGFEFDHKQRRYGMTEYYFRYGRNTEYETVMVVFGRDNAETFCPDYVDDQDTDPELSSSEEDIQPERDEGGEPTSEIFSTSSDSIQSFSKPDDEEPKKELPLSEDSDRDEEKVVSIDLKDHSELGEEIRQETFTLE